MGTDGRRRALIDKQHKADFYLRLQYARDVRKDRPPETRSSGGFY
jgi:hypothetical protein